MSKLVRGLAARLGRRLARLEPAPDGLPPDATELERTIWAAVRPYTMTSVERIMALVRAVQHVDARGVEGAIVECGVWRGGSMMAAAMASLAARPASPRELVLFDTFAGMPDARPEDVDHQGRAAAGLLAAAQGRPDAERRGDAVLAFAPLDDVRRNVLSTGYPADRVRFVAGRVEETVPARAPERIAVLRLDTDWYESTRHELEHLYPRLAAGGVLIIDDYGHWAGARRAVDEFFQAAAAPPLLARIDYTGRVAVKP